jgi:type IV secretory pathway ATPase VirB11/archaellum biosynthesis ATPase
MAVDYTVEEDVIKVDCRNWVIEPSIENSEACMAVVIDILQEVKNAQRIVLSEARDIEYDFDQTQLLASIARIYNRVLNEDKLLSIEKLGPKECGGLLPTRFRDLQFLIFEILRKDPLGAYVKLNVMVNAAQEKMKKAKSKQCYSQYLNEVLLPMKAMFESSEFIKAAKPYMHGFKFGDRSIYRELFKPVVRPTFMQTRYMIIPPKGGKLLDKYQLSEGTQVEIYSIPGHVRNSYFITPPEFRLTDEKYEVLDAARKYMTEHRPKETEFADPEKAREVFMNISRGLVRDVARTMNIALTDKEVEELAVVLSRYTAGFGVLELLLSDDKIQDLFINSPIGITPIYIYHSDFEECVTNLIPTKEDAEAWATRFRLYSGRPLDEANPVLDTELTVPGGRARVAAITRTLSPEGLAFALRRHREKPWTFPLFVQNKFMDPLYAGLMSFLVDGGRALLIAGGRSSGKTSLLGALMLEILRKFRIVIQEDTLELPAVHMRKLGYNIERLKSRSVITQVETELAADEALRTALRLGDSVMIVGEVRSLEGKALFEAMRIGALANTVAGTIHGESAYGVYDRVVNDLGVPSTSFKAIDLITICSMLHSPDGLHRFRRITNLTEVRKHWKDDPSLENGFVNLMEYSAKEDRLKPTDVLMDGESEVLNEIAKRVREWQGRWDVMWDNILLRAKINEATVKYASQLQRPDLLEAEWTTESNEVFHIISDKVKGEVGGLDSNLIYSRWEEWFKNRMKQK